LTTGVRQNSAPSFGQDGYGRAGGGRRALLLHLDEGIGNGVQALGYEQFLAWRRVLSELGVERGAFSLGGTFHSPVIDDPA